MTITLLFWFSAIMGWVSYCALFFSAPLIANFFHHTELINLSRFLFASLLFSSLGTVPAAYLFKNMMVKETALLRITSLIISGVVGIVLALKGYAYWSLAWQQLLLYHPHESLALLYHSLASLISHRFQARQEDVSFLVIRYS